MKKISATFLIVACILNFSGAFFLAPLPAHAAVDSYTKLLIHADGSDGSTSFTDSALGKTITVNGNVQIDTAQSKFGGASALFDGSNDFLSLASNADWAFGTGDFTIDMWVRWNSSTTNLDNLFRVPVVGGIHLYWDGGSFQTNKFVVSDNSTNIISADWGPPTNGRWYHIAVVRSGTNMQLFVDGTSIATVTNSTNFGQSTAIIGGYTAQSTWSIDGWIDEVRVSKGIARWTSNFTPPSQPYPLMASLGKPANNLGLVGYWSFEDATSTKATDFSGNGNTATLSGSTLPTWVNGKRGKALSFDGSSSYVESANNLGITGTQSRTITFWAKYNGSGSGEMVSIGTASANQLFAPMINGGIWYLNGHTAGNDYSTGVTADTLWHFHVITYDGTTAHWYLDGAELGSGFTHTFATADNKVRIGARIDNAFYFNGIVDDVRIYNRVLGASEMARMQNNGTVKFTSNSKLLTQGSSLDSGLVGLWTFDGADVYWSSASAGSAYDRSGGNNHGTLTNMTRSGSVDAGKLGQSLAFSATNSSYVNVPSNFINQLNPVSISTWARWDGTQSSGGPFTFGRYAAISGHQQNGVAQDYIIALDGTNPATAHIWWCPRSSVECLVSTSVAGSGVWHHIVGTDNGTTANLYIDGVLEATGAVGGTHINSTANPFTIGAWINDGSSYSTGRVDDFRVYNRVLTTAEALQLYRLGGAKAR